MNREINYSFGWGAPPAWPQIRLGDLIDEAAYGTSVKCSEAAQGVPVLRMGNVRYDGRLDLADLKYAPLTDAEMGKFGLVAGDILFNRTNSKELVGKTGVWDGRFPAAAASYFIRVRVKQEVVLPEWVWWFMNSAFMKRRLFETARGAIGQANINSEELKAFSIPVPPLDEQRRIVDILNHAASIRRLREEARAKAREVIPALFVEMFGDPAMNPKGWPVSPLGDLIRHLEGGKNLQAGDGEKDGSGLRILKVSAVTSGFFRPLESKPAPNGYQPPPSHFVRKDDLLFSRANTVDLVGATAFVHETPRNILLPDKLWRFVWNEPSAILPFYMLHFFQQQHTRAAMSRMATGTSDSMKNISQAKLVTLTVMVPPLPLQQEFAERVTEVEGIAALNDKAVEVADQMAASLMAQVFGGPA